MNQKNKQFVPLCYVASFALFLAIIIGLAQGAWTEYGQIQERNHRSANELTTMKERVNRSNEELKNDEMHLKSIKQVYQTNSTSEATDNLVMFGNMFDEIIKKAQVSGLLIRSIEYDMKPASNAIYANFATQYNTCQVKFFLVGKYTQLREFLSKINNEFPFLLSISKLNITAFNGNTDYILINLAVTLYSKKPVDNTEE